MAKETSSVQFSGLPFDIREHIWKLALPLQPRVIKLNLVYRASPRFWVAEGTILPEMFRVCREFSEVILRRYEKSPTVFANVQKTEKIYVDYTRDTFFFPYRPWFQIQRDSASLPSPNLCQRIELPLDNSRIRSLAIVKRGGKRYGGDIRKQTELESLVFTSDALFLTQILPKFPNLKEFFLVLGTHPGTNVDLAAAHLVDQSEIYEDSFIPDGRLKYLSIFAKVVGL